jgi:hypothetical protein
MKEIPWAKIQVIYFQQRLTIMNELNLNPAPGHNNKTNPSSSWIS